MTEPRFDELLSRLVRADIRFVLVGGLAVGAWGVVRGTADVDIVVDPESVNLHRLAELAEQVGGRAQMEGALIGSAPSIEALLASGERVMIETEFGALDVVQGLDGVPPYQDLTADAAHVEILGAPVLVCSLPALRAMKRAAGRARDIADLEDLDAANDA